MVDLGVHFDGTKPDPSSSTHQVLSVCWDMVEACDKCARVINVVVECG